jgi:hypothetical protein
MAEKNISFSDREVEALKRIVSDWLQEELTLPPFEPEIQVILRKLDLGSTQTTVAVAEDSTEASGMECTPF